MVKSLQYFDAEQNTYTQRTSAHLSGGAFRIASAELAGCTPLEGTIPHPPLPEVADLF